MSPTFAALSRVQALPRALAARLRTAFRTQRPAQFLCTADAVKSAQASWTAAIPYEVAAWRPPRGIGARTIDFGAMVAAQFPAQGLVGVPDGELVGADGWAFTADGALLHQLSWYGDDTEPIRVPRRRAGSRFVRGRCLSLASTWASCNYGHFVLDALPRAHLVERAGAHLDQYDAVVLPTPLPGVAERMVGRLRVDPSRIVWAEPSLRLRADELVVPTFPGIRRNYPRWAVSWIRELMDAPVSGEFRRRVYVTRRGYSRNAVNEGELLDCLARHGIEVIDPVASADPVADFAACDLVVGASGSALTNLAFCRPGCRVVELVPTDHVFPYYYTLSDSAGLDYRYLVCPSMTERRDARMNASHADFVVPIDELDAALNDLTRPSVR